MAAYRDPWKRKSRGGMKILTNMAKATYKAGKAASKKSRASANKNQNKGCLLLFVVGVSIAWAILS